MSERDDAGAEKRAPVWVATREQFDEAVEKLFWTGQPIEAPSLEMLAESDVDLEDEAGGIEGCDGGEAQGEGRRVPRGVRRAHHQGARSRDRAVAQAVEAERAHPPAQLRQRGRLPRRQRAVPRP